VSYSHTDSWFCTR